MNREQSEHEEASEKDTRAAMKELNSKLKTPFKAMPVPQKSSQASRYYKSFAQKKRDQIENDSRIGNSQPSI